MATGVNLTFEQVLSFFTSDQIEAFASDERLSRVSWGGGRYYYELDDDLNPSFYMGGTTFAGKVMPDESGDFLLKWAMENFVSFEEMKSAVNRYAQYGTLLHKLLGDFARSGQITDNEIRSFMNKYFEEENIPEHVYYSMWINRIRKDLLCFRQFCLDHDVVFLAIEFPIKHKFVASNGDLVPIATSIDAVIAATFMEKGLDPDDPYKSGPRKGEPREKKMPVRKRGILDYKSKSGAKNRGVFYGKEECQLATNRAMWNAKYGEIFPIENIYNWSPNDWITNPGYHFKDQTDTVKADNLQDYINIGAREKIFTLNKRSIRFQSLSLTNMAEDVGFEIKNLAESVRAYEQKKQNREEQKSK